MLDFSPVHNGTISHFEFSKTLTYNDLIALTNEMIDAILAEIADADAFEVTFVYNDLQADDGGDKTPWTLPHVVVHATASAEESAALALTLARGVEVKERSRYETPWQEVHTMQDIRQRLEESRRMRLAMLDAWPETPHLDNIQDHPYLGKLNAISRYVAGLSHDATHLGQIREMMRQARLTRPVPASAR